MAWKVILNVAEASDRYIQWVKNCDPAFRPFFQKCWSLWENLENLMSNYWKLIKNYSILWKALDLLGMRRKSFSTVLAKFLWVGLRFGQLQTTFRLQSCWRHWIKWDLILWILLDWNSKIGDGGGERFIDQKIDTRCRQSDDLLAKPFWYFTRYLHKPHQELQKSKTLPSLDIIAKLTKCAVPEDECFDFFQWHLTEFVIWCLIGQCPGNKSDILLHYSVLVVEIEEPNISLSIYFWILNKTGCKKYWRNFENFYC